MTSAIQLIILLVLIWIIASILLKAIYLVQQGEAIIIERFGRFERILGPGIHIIIPFIETPRTVVWTFFSIGQDKRLYRHTKTVQKFDLRESVHDFPKQNVITKDNVTMEISAVIYYQITDPRAAIYEVSNLPEAIEKLAQTTLRNIVGSMDLDESLVSRDKVNEKLRIILDDASDKWGVKVNRVELQEVNPPHDIRDAMEKQMRAERSKRASILEAEGQREASVLKARGNAESRILEAESEANARLKIAESESKAIEMVKSAVGAKEAIAYLTALQYTKTLGKLTDGQDNKLVVVPYEASGLAASLGAIKNILDQTK